VKGVATWAGRAAAVVFLALAGGAVSAAEPADLAALDGRKSAFVQGFAGQALACVQQHDTSHHLFHGCIDWHSSVHGFWALTAAARVTKRRDLADFVRGALAPEGIALERGYMEARPGFEMPYGRAWFLRLAIEFERAFDDERLRAKADDLAGSIIAELTEQGIRPQSVSYGSHSWALINLRAYGVHVGDAEVVGFVDRAVEDHFVEFDVPCDADRDLRQRSFMALCTNWAWLVSETIPAERFQTWLEQFLPEPDALVPVTHPANAHLYGLNFSRAWGLWRLYRRTGDERYLKLYRAHLEPTFDQPDWWRGDYRVVGHWVSQFGMFAVMPLFEPDYF
jgi:hypothetical protein